MPPYYNQASPFWAFVADLESQAACHGSPADESAPRANAASHDNEEGYEQQWGNGNPWTQGFAGWPFGPMPHRGRFHGPPPPGSPGPPPPPGHHGPPPTGHHGPPSPGSHGPPPPPPPPGFEGPPPPPPPPPGAPHHGPPHHGPPHHGPHHHRGPPPPFGRGRRGPRNGARGHRQQFEGMENMPPFLEALAEMFQAQFFPSENATPGDEKKGRVQEEKADGSLHPEADVFDTTSAYIVHVSLPGAKKSDVSVDWDAGESSLCVTGMITRPGDEEMLRMLALDERKVGVFERKFRLGDGKGDVDVEGISAKMEDGVLRVEVPKTSVEEGFVEVRRVDVE